jgi:hypothetical protein
VLGVAESRGIESEEYRVQFAAKKLIALQQHAGVAAALVNNIRVYQVH